MEVGVGVAAGAAAIGLAGCATGGAVGATGGGNGSSPPFVVEMPPAMPDDENPDDEKPEEEKPEAPSDPSVLVIEGPSTARRSALTIATQDG